jgi:transcriptional regulator of arginine metabolism
MNNHSMSDKFRRQLVVRRLLQRGAVTSQDELQRLLDEHGIEVTQATLSRDLRELGVLKGPGGYVLPESGTPSPIESGAATLVLRSYLRDAVPAGTLVVAKTGPGQAPALALEFDRGAWPEIVGTIAGDDTVFIATESNATARSLASKLIGHTRRQRGRGRA